MKGNWVKLTGFIFAGVAAMTILSTKLAMAAPPTEVCTSLRTILANAGLTLDQIIAILQANGCL